MAAAAAAAAAAASLLLRRGLDIGAVACGGAAAGRGGVV